MHAPFVQTEVTTMFSQFWSFCMVGERAGGGGGSGGGCSSSTHQKLSFPSLNPTALDIVSRNPLAAGSTDLLGDLHLSIVNGRKLHSSRQHLFNDFLAAIANSHQRCRGRAQNSCGVNSFKTGTMSIRLSVSEPMPKSSSIMITFLGLCPKGQA